MSLESDFNRFSMMSFGEGMLALPWGGSLTAAVGDVTAKATRQTFIGLYGGFDLGPQGTTPSSDPDPGMAFWGRGSNRPLRLGVLR